MHKASQQLRRGLTIIELLVVISIIGILMAILLPAIMGASASARRTQCANNIRNVGLALLHEAEAKGRFPAAGHWSPTTPDRYHSWVVTILPWLDRKDVRRNWDLDLPVTDPQNAAQGGTSIAVLTCPADISVESGQGNLSYVVNGGIGYTIPNDCPAVFRSPAGGGSGTQPIDLNGNGLVSVALGVSDGTPSDRDLFRRMGLFFLENWPAGSGATPRYHTLGSIDDGHSQTIMLAENVRAGYDPLSGSNWSWPDPARVMFFLSGFICTNASCSAGNVDYSRVNSAGGPWEFEALNASLTQAEGEAPWPSSYHAGGLNVVFVDGRVQFLSENVDGLVYARLVSPQGTLLEGPLAQGLQSEGAY